VGPLGDEVEPAVDELLLENEDELLEQLGRRAHAIEGPAALDDQFDFDVSFDLSGARDAFRQLGARIYQRWEREAFGLVCGAGSDGADREKLADAFGVGGTAVAAMITAGLASAFGLAPAIAAVIAAIVVKRFLQPAYEEFCVVWADRLGQV
jgi:hypothetical protein